MVVSIVCLFFPSHGHTASEQGENRSWVLSDEAEDKPFETEPEESMPPDATSSSPYKVTLFRPEEGESGARLWSQTKLMAGLGVGVAGFIALLPEEVSKWDRDDSDSLLEKWWENVSEGPIWDRDDWYLNWIGHSYFGGVYYQVARKSGFNQWNSFVYSALMSTFYWEYGLEAFAEVPSLQDLVITPIGGWLYGEWAHNKEKEILASGGKVLGSETTGSIALFFLDPVDRIGIWINKLCRRRVVKTGSWSFTSMASPPDKDGFVNETWQLNVTLVF